MKNKLILEFNEFMKTLKVDNTEKLNEGGGAGKDFTLYDTNIKVEFVYSKGVITTTTKSIEIGEKLDIIGYQDGMSDISTVDLFEPSVELKVDEEKFGDLIFDKVCYDGEGNFEGKTLKELSFEYDIKYTFEFNRDLNKMIGAGYIPTSFKEGDVIEIDKFDDYDEELELVDFDDYKLSGFDFKTGKNITDGIINIKIVLKTKEKFINLWDEIFDDEDEEEPLSEEDFYEQHRGDLKMNYGI